MQKKKRFLIINSYKENVVPNLKHFSHSVTYIQRARNSWKSIVDDPSRSNIPVKIDKSPKELFILFTPIFNEDYIVKESI